MSIQFAPLVITIIPTLRPGAGEINTYCWAAESRVLDFLAVTGIYRVQEIGTLQLFLEPDRVYDLSDDIELIKANYQRGYVSIAVADNIYTESEADVLYTFTNVNGSGHTLDDTVSSNIVPNSPMFTGQSTD